MWYGGREEGAQADLRGNYRSRKIKALYISLYLDKIF